MDKQYRRPKVKSGEIKAQLGKKNGEIDWLIYFGDDVLRCDRALVVNALFCDSLDRKSLVDELELRGYDMDTFKFSIQKK